MATVARGPSGSILGPPPTAVTARDEVPFDLAAALAALQADKPKLVKRLNRDEQRVKELRTKIVTASRTNFILERELNEVEAQIKRLVQNAIKVQDVISLQAGLQRDDGIDGSSPIAANRENYQDLFYFLQSKPRYLAILARELSGKDIPTFVQTVVFDLYGDQYDTREERLLLHVFRLVLKKELDVAKDQGSLFRANTATTQMLSAYAKRGQGVQILKDVLAEPLTRLLKDKDLELEINPLKVYQSMLSKHESETGKPSPLPREVTDEQAKANPEVAAILEKRKSQLFEWCDTILHRVMDAVDTIPYGMRWICKQLGALCVARFPDATRYEVGSLIGGYVYLRFFNPAVVAPDAAGIITTKPTKIGRRNLILVAKVLQNLSNGVTFKKEQHMKPVNEWLASRLDTLQDYFDRLIAVDDLEDSLQVDKYLEHTGVNIINISYNQIFQCHTMCAKHLAKIAPDARDPIRSIVSKLGAPPEPLSKKEDRIVALQLLDRRKRRESSTTDHFAVRALNPLFIQTKQLVLAVLRRLPAEPGNLEHLLDFLEAHKKSAAEQRQVNMHENLDNAICMLRTIVGRGIVRGGEDVVKAVDSVLWGFAEESMNRTGRIASMERRLELVEQAMQSINAHHQYLTSRLEMYVIYLENVRMGPQSQGVRGSKVSGGNTSKKTALKDLMKKKKNADKKKAHRFSHNQLVDMGVLTRLKVEVKKSLLKNCTYTFTQVEPGLFVVELRFKKAIEIKVLNQPIELKLEELLRLQESGQVYLELEFVSLNVNLLIYLLNTHFMASG